MLVLPLLLGTHLPSLWSPPSPLHTPVPIPLSCQGKPLTLTLTPHDLMMWTDGFVPFSFGKGGSGVLAYAHFVPLRPLFPFHLAQYVLVFALKPGPLCKLSAGFGSTNKSAIFLLFSDSRSVLALSSLWFYLKLSGIFGRNYLFFPLYNQTRMGPRKLISPEKRRG